ncbi:MAG: EFR1 family ferrodoxin [Eggerthellaceae bacterium]|nr:EFR1 family ferrodoxin [Eggerthellaceae bacterium]
MKISKATVLYFSGTGTTEKYARAFAAGLPCACSVEAIRHDGTYGGRCGSDELFVLAVPVYAGFAPQFVWQMVADLEGAGTPAVLLAVYGARDYDNALHEMSAKLSAKGFAVVGAAALVARHSIAPTVAATRPDADDLAQAGDFARTVVERVEAMSSVADAPTFEFKTVEANLGAPVFPAASEACVECGVCAAECPAGAIPADAPNTTDTDVCVHCLRCIDVCPNDARSLPTQLVAGVAQMLAAAGARGDKPNEFF